MVQVLIQARHILDCVNQMERYVLMVGDENVYTDTVKAFAF